MKLIHLSDLHLGKRVKDYSMLEDQDYILKKILQIVDEEAPAGVLIAGDVYNKPVPPAEAVALFDGFLCSLAKRRLQVFVISGNHDSPERIAFGSRIMEAGGVHMSPVYDGTLTPVTLTDGWGPVDVYMLPFVKPAHLRRLFPEEEIGSYTDALRVALSRAPVDPGRRNLLVTHQFVTGAARSESEDISVGGSDNVDASVFEGFDYVALGHLHAPQNCGPRIRYCGTPLKYSFSEAKDQKSVTVVELGQKGDLTVRTVDLIPRHDLVELRGAYEEVTLRSFYEGTSWQEDYVRITLTDEEDIPDAVGKLRAIYHRLAELQYDNKRTRENAVITGDAEARRKDPFTLFSEFYALQNNQPMSQVQADRVRGLIESIWEDEA